MRASSTLLNLCLCLCAALLASACGVPEVGPSMSAGENCLTCHQGEVAPKWTVAGTVFHDPKAKPAAALTTAQVVIIDSSGRTLTLRANEAGNFYTGEALEFPIRVEIQSGGKRMAMSASPPNGSCNFCHSLAPPPGEAIVPGRLFVPQ